MKLCLAAVVLSAGGMLVFAAAKVDPCTEKYNSCSEVCTNAFHRCKAGGVDPVQCEQRKTSCMNACDKDKKACEDKTKKS